MNGFYATYAGQHNTWVGQSWALTRHAIQESRSRDTWSSERLFVTKLLYCIVRIVLLLISCKTRRLPTYMPSPNSFSVNKWWLWTNRYEVDTQQVRTTKIGLGKFCPRPPASIFLPIFLSVIIQGVQEKLCFFTFHCNPSQRNASVQSLLLASNSLYNQ